MAMNSPATVPRADPKTAAGCVGILAEAFGRTLSAVTIDAYRIGLRGLTPEQIQVATEAALRTCKFMPTPAELRELAGDFRIEDRAAQAWMAVLQALENGSLCFYASVDFDDPAINAAIRAMGGWEQVSIEFDEQRTEFLNFGRRRFEQTYSALARSGVGEEQGAPLMGHTDRVNGFNGFEQKPPRKIETGLPPMAQPARLTAAADIPRVEFKRP